MDTIDEEAQLLVSASEGAVIENYTQHEKYLSEKIETSER